MEAWAYEIDERSSMKDAMLYVYETRQSLADPNTLVALAGARQLGRLDCESIQRPLALGALTFVWTAFKDMPESDFTAITPVLEAIFNRDGWLWMTWGFAALPIGFIVVAIGLLREAEPGI